MLKKRRKLSHSRTSPLEKLLLEYHSLKYEQYGKVAFIIFREAISKTLLHKLLEILWQEKYRIAFSGKKSPCANEIEVEYVFAPQQSKGNKTWKRIYDHNFENDKMDFVCETTIHQTIYDAISNNRLIYLRLD